MPYVPSYWSVPSSVPTLSEGEVHVWRADLNEAGTHLRRWAQNLSALERARAERFFSERDRHCFMACRGILREILSGYLATPADQLRFRYGRHGKPYLRGTSGDRLRFNLSHSDALAVFAFAQGRRIGVDVERVRPDLPWQDIAGQFFTRRENERLRHVGETQRPRAFLRAWTCKEAYVKARGQGLFFPVNRVEVSLSPPALRRVGADENEAARWRVRELRVGGAYVATVVVEEDEGRLRCWQWR